MLTFAFLQNINGPEILLIFLIVLLLFGAKRLPELFKSFGKSIREFKKATSDIEEDIRSAMDEEPSKPAAPKQVQSNKATPANSEKSTESAVTSQTAASEEKTDKAQS